MCGDDFFAPQSILRRNNRTLIETVTDCRNGFLDLGRFGSDDAEFAIGELIWLGCSFERHMKFMLSRDSQTFAVERPRVIFAADKSPNLHNPRQMRRVQTANCATSDDANTLHLSRRHLAGWLASPACSAAETERYTRLSTFTSLSA